MGSVPPPAQHQENSPTQENPTEENPTEGQPPKEYPTEGSPVDGPTEGNPESNTGESVQTEPDEGKRRRKRAVEDLANTLSNPDSFKGTIQVMMPSIFLSFYPRFSTY